MLWLLPSKKAGQELLVMATVQIAPMNFYQTLSSSYFGLYFALI